MASSQRQWVSKEEYKVQKELEAARKAGTAPPETDEEGNMINPHIPQYISRAPWYTDPQGPTLKHQRKLKEKKYDNDWYKRGARKGPAATKYRKGACQNCGSLTHKSKDCMERPRKRGAKLTGKDIKPDELIEDFEFNYDGKRDRWNGYDPSNYKEVIERFERTDKERRKFMSKQPKEDSVEVKEDDDVRQEEEGGGVTTKADPKHRTAKPSLRIRGDTAKYLINLDPESPFYDPKTRSMRGNPHPKTDPSDLHFAGENALRFTGDTVSFANMQLYASEAYDRGQDVHLQATPSLAETLHKKYHERKENMVKSRQKDIIEKYGGKEHLDSLPPELIHAQTEEYVEYAPDGRVIKGKPKAVAKSRYEEDVYINNHTSVWGSFWIDGKWGYACCKQTIKKSYCLASAQKREASEGTKTEDTSHTSAQSERATLNDMLRKKIEAKEAELAAKKGKNQDSEASDSESESSYTSSSYESLSESETNTRKKRKHKKRKRSSRKRHRSRSPSRSVDGDEQPVFKKQRSKYNSVHDSGTNPTDEEMERYHKDQVRWDDPMKHLTK